MKLLCYALHDFAPKLVAAKPQRQWMDEFADRHAYRCLPLTIANAHGWEALCPVPIEIAWNGGPGIGDVAVRPLKKLPGGNSIDNFCRSNFSRGIITFHLEYIFRTEAGWDLIGTGPFNRPKDNAYPLTGIIETDWLPYPFTMNWQIQRPGRVVFEEDEPFCFIFPIMKQSLIDIEPEIHRLSENLELTRQHNQFHASREEFMKRFHAGDAATLRQAWQKHYFLGRFPDGTQVDGHLNKLRLNEPTDRRLNLFTSSVTSENSASKPKPVRKESDPRWEDDSPLNEIESGQSNGNEVGRLLVDVDGHLTDWKKTIVVRSSEDAVGDFLVADNLLSPRECDALCHAFWELADITYRSNDIDPYWNNRFIWFADIAAARPALGQLMIDAQKRAIELIKTFYRLKAPVYPDLLQIVKWESGMFMRPHADNANPDGSVHEMAYRDFPGILYLNDDYSGGELYLTDLDVAIEPKRGMLVGLTGGFHHEHAVLRIEAGTRLTMPFFLTFNAEKADHSITQHTAVIPV
jgi:hypothetical protein